MRFDLATGNWIEMTPIQKLKAKHRDAHDGAPRFYIKFDDDGKPDMSDLPVSATLASLQRDALLGTLVTDWSFLDDNEQKLPLPKWDGEVTQNRESLGEIDIDDWDEILAILAPYLAKVRRKPDPKETTMGGSTAS